MRELDRLGSLLEMYENVIDELMSWDDPGVADLIIRLGVWRAAAELEVMFVGERERALAA